MRRLTGLILMMLLGLVACAPPLNLNRTMQAVNIYGAYTVAYSDKWFVDPQFGRIAFSNDEPGLEAYLRNSPMTGELVAGGIFALPKGEGINTIEDMLNNYQETMIVSLSNRETFTENNVNGISGTGTAVISNIAVDVGVVVTDLGDAFGIVVYYTAVGKVNNPMWTIRRMAATITFMPTQ